jgi:hypothetical protein
LVLVLSTDRSPEDGGVPVPKRAADPAVRSAAFALLGRDYLA